MNTRNAHAPLWLRTGLVILAALGAVAIAASARAHDEKHWKRKGPPFVPPGHVYYYQSVPVVYAPRPIVVVPPPAVIYGREPVYYYGAPQPGVNLNINVPLR
jgi:hypothetical protein